MDHGLFGPKGPRRDTLIGGGGGGGGDGATVGHPITYTMEARAVASIEFTVTSGASWDISPSQLEDVLVDEARKFVRDLLDQDATDDHIGSSCSTPTLKVVVLEDISIDV